ncbi:MAG: glycosyltransferase family 39 protein [Candidatus Omnitrophica bacterium]|nr:glycosyltransferase family 39 protein [Candidatus Omnitrophota bacterium]
MRKIENFIGLVILMALFFLMSVYALVYHVKCINFPYPLEYREGVVGYWVNQLFEKRPLYPEIKDEPPFIHNPYTPLYYVLTGFLQKVLPQSHIFFPGRLLSFLSLLTLCFFIVKLVKLHCKNIAAGAIAACLFFCSPLSINYCSLEIVDTLGLCIGVAGLYFATRKTKKGLLASGILCASAIITKPTFIIPAIAISLYLTNSREKQKIYFYLGFFLPLLIIFCVVLVRYSTGVFTHLIKLNILPLSFSHFLNVFSIIGIRHSFLLGFLGGFLVLMKNKKDPLYWYCLLSPVTLLFSAKIGAESNYLLEILVLSSICTGILFERVEKPLRKVFLLTCISQMFLFLPFKPAPVFTKTYGQEIPAAIESRPTDALKQTGEIISGELMAVTDPVLSEDIGWLVMSGKKVIIEPYQFSQLAKYGRWDDSFVVGMINEKEFNLILLSADSYEKGSEKFTRDMLKAIKENYQIKRVVGNTYLLEPVMWKDEW